MDLNAATSLLPSFPFVPVELESGFECKKIYLRLRPMRSTYNSLLLMYIQTIEVYFSCYSMVLHYFMINSHLISSDPCLGIILTFKSFFGGNTLVARLSCLDSGMLHSP